MKEASVPYAPTLSKFNTALVAVASVLMQRCEAVKIAYSDEMNAFMQGFNQVDATDMATL